MKKLLPSILCLLVSFNCYAGLTVGVNCGFVAAAPVANPNGTAAAHDNSAFGFKDTSPADATGVNEVGFFCPSASQDVNWEGGIYTHDAGNDRPNALLAGADQSNALGTNNDEWKVASGVSTTISGSTTYWIGTQVDNTSPVSQIDYVLTPGEYRSATAATLPATWTSDSGASILILASYAVYTTEAPARRVIIISKYNPKFGYNVLGRN